MEDKVIQDVKKKTVNTGQIILKIIAIVAIAAAVISAVIDVVRGTPLLEVFTERPLLWVGALLPAFVIFFLLGSDKSNKEDESNKDKESK
jgi:flagellar basal body-associated protein FliL